jgi:hypothetical protein
MAASIPSGSVASEPVHQRAGRCAPGVPLGHHVIVVFVVENELEVSQFLVQVAPPRIQDVPVQIEFEATPPPTEMPRAHRSGRSAAVCMAYVMPMVALWSRSSEGEVGDIDQVQSGSQCSCHPLAARVATAATSDLTSGAGTGAPTFVVSTSASINGPVM